MTKEEIYNKEVGSCSQNHGYEKEIKIRVFSAMEEYASQVSSEKERSHAIGFAEWLNQTDRNSMNKEGEYLYSNGYRFEGEKTALELYELYLQSLTKLPESTNENNK